MNKEEIVNKYIIVANELSNAQDNFKEAIRAYEEKTNELYGEIGGVLYAAKENEEISPMQLVRIARIEAKLNILLGRFNGLKCELT